MTFPDVFWCSITCDIIRIKESNCILYSSKFIQAEALLPQWGQYFFVKEDLFWGRKIISLVAVGKPMILAELISVTVGARGKIYAWYSTIITKRDWQQSLYKSFAWRERRQYAGLAGGNPKRKAAIAIWRSRKKWNIPKLLCSYRNRSAWESTESGCCTENCGDFGL